LTTTNPPFLQVSEITKYYGSHRVLNQVTFEIAKGEIVGFVGPNGAGKSTTMKIICSLVKPNSGSVELEGIDLHSEPQAFLARVGALLDGPSRYPSLRAYDHLAFLTRIRGNYDRKWIESVLEKVGLDPKSKKPTSKFSMGMKQRLGVAMAIVNRPELLILDEPMNGLDPAGMVELREFIKDLSKDQGVTVFLSSHLLNEIEQVCDRVLFLKEGRLVRNQRLSKGETPKSQIFRIRTSDDLTAAELLSAREFASDVEVQADGLKCVILGDEGHRVAPLLVQSGIRLYEFTPMRETLESLYLSDYKAGPHDPIR
jgi:ABC-2 type transport system ATP-binding protein